MIFEDSKILICASCSSFRKATKIVGFGGCFVVVVVVVLP